MLPKRLPISSASHLYLQQQQQLQQQQLTAITSE
jgi:hypothetical protein